MRAQVKLHLTVGAIAWTSLIALTVSVQPAQSQQEVAPKLVCYYTNWAKDRPDPWSYVSVSKLPAAKADSIGSTNP